MLTITIDSKDCQKSFYKLSKSDPARLVAKSIAQNLVQGMKSRVPVWKGNLMRSIQSRMTKDGYNIYMNFYGSFVERGHGPSPLNRYMVNWAFSKLGSNRAFAALATLATIGAKPHPFVQPSIDSTMSNFNNIAGTEIKSVLKESGFK